MRGSSISLTRNPSSPLAAAPNDKTGATQPLKEWKLQNYIDVAHEIGWITQTGSPSVAKAFQMTSVTGPVFLLVMKSQKKEGKTQP